MGEIAEDIMDGLCCAWCGVYFEEEHGYPVLCKSCWKDAIKKESPKQMLKKYGVQKAIFEDV